jgi:sterol 3beta-glucosyltransferase
MPAFEEFLAAGDKPIYLGFGSMPWGAAAQHRDHPQGPRDVGRPRRDRPRLGRHPHRGPAGLASTSIDKAPHTKLFELVQAVVHHGGAGTTHTGLYAGKPTFIVPQIFDQPYWGRRVYELGCGPPPVRLRKLTPRHPRKRRSRSCRPTSRMSWRRWTSATKLMHEDGTGLACDIIEETIAEYPGNAHSGRAHGRSFVTDAYDPDNLFAR